VSIDFSWDRQESDRPVAIAVPFRALSFVQKHYYAIPPICGDLACIPHLLEQI